MARKKRTTRTGRSGGVNKSQAIRDKKQQLGQCRPIDIVDALKKDGVTVSYGLVANVLSREGKKTGAKRGRPRKTSRGGSGTSMSALLTAKKLVDESGSLADARATLDMVAKLIGD